MAIGNCDCCERRDVPGSVVDVPGEPFACYLCQGDIADPYGELDDERTEACPGCGGDGGHEVWTHYDPRDGSPLGYWQPCRLCDATGDFVAEMHPIVLSDLDEFVPF
jgi:hypothetical protein